MLLDKNKKGTGVFSVTRSDYGDVYPKQIYIGHVLPFCSWKKRGGRDDDHQII